VKNAFFQGKEQTDDPDVQRMRQEFMEKVVIPLK